MGLSTAADSLTAIAKYVFEEQALTADQLIAAVDADFEGEPDIKIEIDPETIKKANDKSYKIITFLGFQIKLRRKKWARRKYLLYPNPRLHMLLVAQLP